MNEKFKIKRLGVPLSSVKSLEPSARGVLFMLAVVTVEQLLDRIDSNREDIANIIDNLPEVEVECRSLVTKREASGPIDLTFGGLD